MAFPSDAVSQVENAHSTVTALAGGASFTPSVPIDMRQHGAVVASVLTDQAGTLYVESSPDARAADGSVNASAHWDQSVSQAVAANVQIDVRLVPSYQFVRVRYVNGATLQGSIRLQTTTRVDAAVAPASVSAPGGGALATATKQDTGNASLASIKTNTDKIPSKGGAAAAGSTPVTLATEDAAKVPSLGQALAAGSVPVVLPVAQVSALAQDSTLTGGSQKAIVRAAAKGATSAADVTSTANGADHQGVDTTEQFQPVYEDNSAGRAIVEQRNSYQNITSATTTTVKSGAGYLHLVQINSAVALATITVYDNTAGSGTKIGTITMPAALLASQATIRLDVAFGAGLTIVTTGAQDLTVSYR